MLLRQLKEAGVELVLATDAGTGRMGLVPGFSLHQELRLLTRNGFTPYEAIKTATVNAAAVVKRMTGQVDFGRIEVGKRADLILTNGNPLDAVENITNPRGVMASGRWYDRQMLQKMLEPPYPGERAHSSCLQTRRTPHRLCRHPHWKAVFRKLAR